jgi:hypothetical protein
MWRSDKQTALQHVLPCHSVTMHSWQLNSCIIISYLHDKSYILQRSDQSELRTFLSQNKDNIPLTFNNVKRL